MTTLVILEDNDVIRIGLITVFEAAEDFNVLGAYSQADEMLSNLYRHRPDVVILGGGGEILDRCRTCQEVRTRCPSTKVLTLSERRRDDELYEIILSGASGSILKHAGSAEMVRSVGVVACGGLNFESDALVRLLKRIPSHIQVGKSALLNQITERERTLSALVAQGFTNGEIAERLNLSKFTVRNNISEVRGKLNLKSRTELATFVVQHNLVDLSESPLVDEYPIN